MNWDPATRCHRVLLAAGRSPWILALAVPVGGRSFSLVGRALFVRKEV
ncbi:MAG: hypothetical protein ACLT9P_10115 [Evtepia gabavorous]